VQLVLHGYQILFVAIGVAATVIALLIFIFVKKLASGMREVMETKAADH